jgi:ribosome-binding protein aMBF1 (putative translation factor)
MTQPPAAMTAHRINGKRVRLAREYRGLSRWDLATQLGVSVPVITKAESLRREFPRELFDQLVFVLHFPPAWFWQDDPPELPPTSLDWH